MITGDTLPRSTKTGVPDVTETGRIHRIHAAPNKQECHIRERGGPHVYALERVFRNFRSIYQCWHEACQRLVGPSYDLIRAVYRFDLLSGCVAMVDPNAKVAFQRDTYGEQGY